MKRLLILTLAGKNICFGLTYGDIQRAITSLPDDDVDSMKVERLFDVDTHCQPFDVTLEFAAIWARSFDYGPGDEPESYLSTFPAFIRHYIGDKLITEFEDARPSTFHQIGELTDVILRPHGGVEFTFDGMTMTLDKPRADRLQALLERRAG